MNQETIERLNYYNGQRLEADDFRLEQEYHIQVQRWLSKSLFTPGVADGFEVFPIEDPLTKKKTRVLVTPGLALDDLGRAIILVRPAHLTPEARYLCVRYAERKDRREGDQCTPNGSSRDESARWGGPARIVSAAELFWRSAPPRQDARELVIAVLELNPDCSVERVVSGPAKVAVANQLSRVFSYALEGEKNIDARNSKVLRFHINGRRPNAVTLSIRSAKFSTLHYTEMASHTHNPSVAGQGASATVPSGPASSIDPHTHDATGLNAQEHTHSLRMSVFGSTDDLDKDKLVSLLNIPPKPGINIWDIVAGIFTGGASLPASAVKDAVLELAAQGVRTVDMGTILAAYQVSGGAHGITGNTGALIEAQNPQRHTHSVAVTVSNALVGSTGLPPRGGSQLSFLSNLKVSIDGSPKVETTRAIVAQIARLYPNIWTEQDSLGGTAVPETHPLVVHGTGLIRLDLLDVENISFGPGAHEIEFSVEGAGNGGCLQYNLYIE